MRHTSRSTLTIKEDSKMVHLDEIKKMGTRKSTKQDDGGEGDNPGNDMDVSFDCN